MVISWGLENNLRLLKVISTIDIIVLQIAKCFLIEILEIIRYKQVNFFYENRPRFF